MAYMRMESGKKKNLRWDISINGVRIMKNLKVDQEIILSLLLSCQVGK